MVSLTGRLRARGVEVALDASDPPEILLRLAVRAPAAPPPGAARPPGAATRIALRPGHPRERRPPAPAHAAARRAGQGGPGARAARLRAVPRVRHLRRLGRRQRRPWSHGRARLDPRAGAHVRAAGAAGGGLRAAARPRARPAAAAAGRRDLPVRGHHARARGRHAGDQLRARALTPQAWTSAHMQSHGGVVGEALFRLASPLVQGVGVGILVVFLAITGTMLLTGSSLGTLLRDLGRPWSRGGRASCAGACSAASGPAQGGEARPYSRPHDDFPAPAALTHAGGRLRGRRHLGGGAGCRARARRRGLRGRGARSSRCSSPSPSRRGRGGGRGRLRGDLHAGTAEEGEELTPQGRYRGSVTDDPEFVWELPDAGASC